MVVIPSMSTCCKKSSVVHIHVHGRLVLDVEEEAEEVEEAQLDLITLVLRVRTGDQVELSTSLSNALERSVPESVSGTECSKGTWTMFSLSITLMKWGWPLQ